MVKSKRIGKMMLNLKATNLTMMLMNGLASTRMMNMEKNFRTSARLMTLLATSSQLAIWKESLMEKLMMSELCRTQSKMTWKKDFSLLIWSKR